MTAPDVLDLAALDEAIEGVLLDRLEHREARTPDRTLAPPQETRVRKRRQPLDHPCAVLSFRRDRLGGVEGAAPRKDGETREQNLVGGIEELVAPVDGPAQRLVARGKIAPAAGQQLQSVLEPPERLLGREQLHPGCGELDREWQAVQPRADLGDGRSVLAGERELRPDGAGPVHEQGDRRGAEGLVGIGHLPGIR